MRSAAAAAARAAAGAAARAAGAAAAGAAQHAPGGAPDAVQGRGEVLWQWLNDCCMYHRRPAAGSRPPCSSPTRLLRQQLACQPAITCLRLLAQQLARRMTDGPDGPDSCLVWQLAGVEAGSRVEGLVVRCVDEVGRPAASGISGKIQVRDKTERCCMREWHRHASALSGTHLLPRVSCTPRWRSSAVCVRSKLLRLAAATRAGVVGQGLQEGHSVRRRHPAAAAAGARRRRTAGALLGALHRRPARVAG